MRAKMRAQSDGKINIILHENKNHDEAAHQQHFRIERHEELQMIEQAFAEYTGLKTFKKHIKEIYAMKKIQLAREHLGLKVSRQSLHMIFKGNPGTGKTTIARKLAQVFGELQVLSRGHFTEVERADLVGEYIGQTAQKTRNVIRGALGGVLFIDEAYSLARGGSKDFGREAIDTLVKQMEDHHQDFLLILAGYPREMDYFLQMNPGLHSRFPFHMPFTDYSVEELLQIAAKMATEKEYTLSSEAKEKLRVHLIHLKQAQIEHFSNGRHIRNVLEKSIRKQSMRLLIDKHSNVHDLMEIRAEDIYLDMEEVPDNRVSYFG